MASPDERALAFLIAKVQDKDFIDCKTILNYDRFVAETTAIAKLEISSLSPDERAKLVETANTTEEKAWLRGHKDAMNNLKTELAAPVGKYGGKPNKCRYAGPEAARAAKAERDSKAAAFKKATKVTNYIDGWHQELYESGKQSLKDAKKESKSSAPQTSGEEWLEHYG